MINMFRELERRGETALHKALWAFAGVSFTILALGLLGSAAAEALSLVMPRYAALGAGAAALAIFAAIAFAFAGRQGDHPNRDAKIAAPEGQQLSSRDNGDWRVALNLALIEEAREKPARAAALAALAGLILGAMEGLNERNTTGA